MRTMTKTTVLHLLGNYDCVFFSFVFLDTNTLFSMNFGLKANE
jgi:hypothetical protein